MLAFNYNLIQTISKYLFIAWIFGSCHAFSQNVTIRGKAHASYAGKIIQLFTLSDYISQINLRENQDTIESDGFFEMQLQSEYTQPVLLRIDKVVATLYVQPDFVYGITIPEIDQERIRNNDVDLPVNIGVISSDSTELNSLIFDFEGQMNDLFISEESRFLSPAAIVKRADSLKKICAKRYEKISNDYFKTYWEYNIACINAGVSRGENYLINSYILNHPIQYQHCEYMRFFNTCFSGYLQATATARKGQSLYNIVNVKQDYNLLLSFLKSDKFLKNDSLVELVLIKNLWDFYFNSEFERESVKNIITQLNQKTSIKEHRRITSIMLAYFNKMQTGSMAPAFNARTKENTVGSLASFKGRWVYLNFFSTTNTESLKEMPKIIALKRKFGDKVSFISICLDDSLKAYKEYLKANPKQDWAIWYDDEKLYSKTAKASYYVTGSEAYFLINNFGYLAQSPALSPSRGIEFKFNLLFKSGKRQTKTGIR